MSKFTYIVTAEPYFYNCQLCDAPLLITNDIQATEKLRKDGVCPKCQARLAVALEKQRSILFARIPWANARNN